MARFRLSLHFNQSRIERVSSQEVQGEDGFNSVVVSRKRREGEIEKKLEFKHFVPSISGEFLEI